MAADKRDYSLKVLSAGGEESKHEQRSLLPWWMWLVMLLPFVLWRIVTYIKEKRALAELRLIYERGGTAAIDLEGIFGPRGKKG